MPHGKGDGTCQWLTSACSDAAATSSWSAAPTAAASASTPSPPAAVAGDCARTAATSCGSARRLHAMAICRQTSETLRQIRPHGARRAARLHGGSGTGREFAHDCVASVTLRSSAPFGSTPPRAAHTVSGVTPDAEPAEREPALTPVCPAFAAMLRDATERASERDVGEDRHRHASQSRAPLGGG
eukprot:COSAG06_NODE_5292_length_3581_cov_226.792391_4_plen_185_part_00